MSRRTRVLGFWIILAVAVGLRLALFSGYGLGDDPNYYTCYHDIFLSGHWHPGRAYDWRFAFWVPIVASMRLLGVTEWGFVGFITLCGVLNVVLVWALARQEWDEPWAALVAMALMAVFPLEVLSSTLFVIDIPLATFCYAAFWLYRESLAERRSVGLRAAAAVVAGVFLFLGYSTKQWGILVGAIFAIEALRRLRTTWAYSALCAGTYGLFMAAYLGWQWVRFGDPIRDIHVVQGVAIFLPHSWAIVTDYSRMLLLPNRLDTWFGGWYVHATLLLALLFFRRVRRAGRWLLYFLVELACLSAMPSHWEKGHFVLLVPHIFRYLCFLSIPLCLALAAYWRELVLWRRPVGQAALAVFLAVSVVQAVDLTYPTRDAFGEQRRANALLTSLFPDERYASDSGFLRRLQDFPASPLPYDRVRFIMGENPEQQAKEMAAITDGVVVTGGARLPWYGCIRCAATMAGFTPPPSWRLVTAFLESPMTPYRKEPLRIWRVSGLTVRVDDLLRDTPLTERVALLRRLVAERDYDTALEVGRRLGSDGIEPRQEVAYLTGMACLETRRPGCAVAEFDRALELGLNRAEARAAVTAMAQASVELRDFAGARRWVARYRERFPDAGPDGAIDDIESGLAEAIARYHALEYPRARATFASIRNDESEDPARRQRAHYFLALTLFRMRRLPEAVAETKSYRERYGEDPSWVELTFRNAEARLQTEPGTARALLENLVKSYPQSFWAGEATRILATHGTGGAPGR